MIEDNKLYCDNCFLELVIDSEKKIKCINCKEEFTKRNGKRITNRYLSLENKKTHFNNYINKLFIYSHNEIKSIADSILDVCAKNKIEKNRINYDIVLSYLKNNKESFDFIKIMYILNYINNINISFNDEDKQKFCIFFNSLIRFISSEELIKQSLSYHIIFYTIFDLLDIKSMISPTERRLKNSSLLLNNIQLFLENLKINKKTHIKKSIKENYYIKEYSDLSYFGLYLEKNNVLPNV